ncbi:MAG TPA: hypothetical protein DCE33_05055 [Rhodospirillaceae bacterium]|nr:hypothetical protein [Rhodospirillaceae bacterium]
MPYEELVRTQVACGAIPAAKGREDDFIRERLELHENPQGEMLREYADGTWFIIKESRTSGGGYVATNTDITELKRTEARLLESERRMSQLIEALQDGFALFDADERLVMWNQKWFNRHSGAAEVIEVGVSFEDLSRAMVRADQIPEAVGREEEFVAERVERHRNPGMPMQRKMNDGRWFIIHEVRTSEGGILSLQTEITDVKRAEETAHELRLEAELANRAKSSLLINMSHELRTPLNAIIGFSQILEQELFGPLGNARYVNYARDVHNSGKHLLALISDLLDISKVELGEAELEESEIDLAECIASCIVMVEHRAMNSGIEVTNEIDPSVGSLKADERRLKQIILNIAGNAIKFSPPKATVAIKTEALESGACKISISDEGPGIDAEEISRITEPFFQTETGLTRQTDGIGLGLYIVSTLCDLHGADLVFDSVPDKGTTVSVIFPPERLGIDRDSQAAE